MKRVFILSRQSILCRGIETLLSQEEGFDIVSRETELDTAVERIQSCRPDVVIINLDDSEFNLTPALLCIMKKKLGIRVIGLSLNDNSICVYQGEQKEIRQVEDLLNAILD